VPFCRVHHRAVHRARDERAWWQAARIPLQSKRFRVGHRLAVDAAIWRPYPLLAKSGEQGSARTVLSKMLKALVDPITALVRALPRKKRELMIAASNGYLLAFDNLSGLPAWLSDALCRLASGGSFAVRQLQAARPLILTRIHRITH
jgi:hypothetical protein